MNKIPGLERKRLYRIEHQKDNIFQKFVPSYFRALPYRSKELLQIKVDEQRNLLYSLSVVDQDSETA